MGLGFIISIYYITRISDITLSRYAQQMYGTIELSCKFMRMSIKKIPEIPLLYLWVHHKLLEQKQTIMHRKCLVETIRRCVRLPPGKYNQKVIDDLEKYGLITLINKRRGYQILQGWFIREDPFF